VDHDSSFGPLLASRGPRRDVHTWDRDEIQFGTERKAGAQTLSGQSGASIQLVMVRVAVESLNYWKIGRQPICAASTSRIILPSEFCT
jgi:hypothetical protein